MIFVPKQPIPDYGDHMTVDEFISACRSNCFTREDGHGYYATKTEMSDLLADPVDVVRGRMAVGFTHVVWFHK